MRCVPPAPATSLISRSLLLRGMWALGLVAVVSAGCNPGGYSFNPVSGKLTIGGQVPQGVQVSLYPLDPKMPIASGTVDGSSGQFTLTSSAGVGKAAGKGAVAGKYKVVLNSTSSGGPGGKSPEEMMKQYGGGGKAPTAPKSTFPKEYGAASTSPKEVEIKSGPNTLDLAL